MLFERVIEPKLEAPYKDGWASLDHVEVTDAYSGTIVLKEFGDPAAGTCRGGLRGHCGANSAAVG
jgi:hypothetical protein